jgi:hypothetical protein
MNNQKLILLAGAALLSTNTFALDVDVPESGTLSSLITDLNTTTLTVSGKLNAKDLFFISENLTSLTSLNLGDAVIESYSGDSLNGQTDYAANLIPAGAFAGTSLAEVVLPTSGAITIGDFAFAGTKITALTMPANVAGIGSAAFACCDGLTTLTVPECTIGTYAFSNCANITEIVLGNNTEVGEGVFARCTKLATVTGSEDLTSIGDYAFMGCSGLQQFGFGEKIKTIGEGAFDGTALNELDLTSSSKLATIGARAFANNTSLQKVTFNQSDAPTLGEGAFLGCTSISTFSMPGVSELPDYVLSETKSISELVLPATLSYIGDNAMTGMTGLSKLDASALSEVPELGTDVWHNVAQSKVALATDENTTQAFKSAEQWKEFLFDINTGVAESIAAGKANVKARFDGDLLQIVATGCDLARVALYDVAGQTLTNVNVNADSASINTADFSTHIYIVTVTLTNGDSATLKLIRK